MVCLLLNQSSLDNLKTARDDREAIDKIELPFGLHNLLVELNYTYATYYLAVRSPRLVKIPGTLLC